MHADFLLTAGVSAECQGALRSTRVQARHTDKSLCCPGHISRSYLHSTEAGMTASTLHLRSCKGPFTSCVPMQEASRLPAGLMWQQRTTSTLIQLPSLSPFWLRPGNHCTLPSLPLQVPDIPACKHVNLHSVCACLPTERHRSGKASQLCSHRHWRQGAVLVICKENCPHVASAY